MAAANGPSPAGEARVALEGVWKRYLLGQRAGARDALRALLRQGAGRGENWALRDLSLEVRAGESLGLIGHNGAGKTTALKLLAGITRPTRGSVRTRGRVASLLNVGAGFHRDLTGRENVFLNGVILGLTRREVAARYDAIVDFAGVERFMDTPVKRYSTGMYARLAFAVAVHVEPDVLLVDEVLSVGDAAFQDRSLRRMLAYRQAGVAVLFVSHNLGAVELMCQRAVWLERGRVRGLGPTPEVVRDYLDALDAGDEAPLADAPQASLVADTVDVLDGAGAARDWLEPWEPFTARVRGRALRELREPVFVLTVRGEHGPLFAGNMHIDGHWPERIPPGPFEVACQFGPSRLAPGHYRVELKVKQNVRTNYFEPRVLARFVVVGDPGAGDEAVGGGDVPHTWRLGDAASPSSPEPESGPAFAASRRGVP